MLPGQDQGKCVKTVMREGISVQSRVRFLMSGDSHRREVSTFHAAALSATQFGSVAGVLSKCTLLPADSPNWRMGEVSV